MEKVNSPSHYQNDVKEVWEMMIDIWGVDKFVAFCQINAFKYRMRAGKKESQSADIDFKKAKWYEDKVEEIKIATNKEFKTIE